MLVKVCPACGRQEYDKLAYERRVQEKKERAAAERRRAKLAARDAEYAKLGTRVVVDCVKTTDGRTLVVETRGQRCAGWRSCVKVSHN